MSDCIRSFRWSGFNPLVQTQRQVWAHESQKKGKEKIQMEGKKIKSSAKKNEEKKKKEATEKKDASSAGKQQRGHTHTP